PWLCRVRRRPRAHSGPERPGAAGALAGEGSRCRLGRRGHRRAELTSLTAAQRLFERLEVRDDLGPPGLKETAAARAPRRRWLGVKAPPVSSWPEIGPLDTPRGVG